MLPILESMYKHEMILDVRVLIMIQMVLATGLKTAPIYIIEEKTKKLKR